MSHHREIDAAAIDKVLKDAVDAGAVPNVAAIAADRDGIIYEGGAGRRIADKESEPVTADTHFRNDSRIQLASSFEVADVIVARCCV